MIDSSRRHLPCKLHVKGSNSHFKLLVGFGKYPTLSNFHLVATEGKLVVSNHMEHLITGPLTMKLKVYSSAPTKIRVMVKFTNNPVVLPPPSLIPAASTNQKENKFSYYYFTKVPLEFPEGKLRYKKPVPLVNYMEKNIADSGKKDRSQEKLVKDRSADVAERRLILKEKHENFLLYKRGADLMAEHERCQKQIDVVNRGKNRVVGRYLLNFLYLVKIFDHIKEMMKVTSFYSGQENLLSSEKNILQTADKLRGSEERRHSNEEVH